jgi:serine protease
MLVKIHGMVVAAMVGFLSSSAALADAYGNVFRVNATTAGLQSLKSASAGANGDVAVLFSNGGFDAPVYIQRYDALGRALQPVDGLLSPGTVAVAVSGTGAYAVARRAFDDGANVGVFATVYGRNGSVLVPEFRINDMVPGPQMPCSIAMNASGQFVVSWLNQAAGIDNQVYVTRYQANGVRLGSPILVRSGPAGCADVALDAWGRFAVTWQEAVSPPPVRNATFARFYDSVGTALGPAFRVHAFSPVHDFNPHLAMSPQGIIVVWDTYGRVAADQWAVYGQRFSAAGVAAGTPFQISTTPTPANANISVAMGADGGFTVAYDDGSDGHLSPSSQSFFRSYSPEGVALGPPTSFTGMAGNGQLNPFVVIDGDGNSTVAWTQWQSSTDIDTYARRFLPAGVSAQSVANPGFVTGISGPLGGFRYFKVSVPPGHSTLDVFISGSTGDADLYVRYGVLPTLSRWDGRPYLDGSNEGASMLRFPPGDWYIGIHGFTAYADVGLNVMSY